MQEAYKAIADPTRRHILKYLRGGKLRQVNWQHMLELVVPHSRTT